MTCGPAPWPAATLVEWVVGQSGTNARRDSSSSRAAGLAASRVLEGRSELGDETEVVQHGGDIEQLGVVRDPLQLAQACRPEVRALAMVDQRVGAVANDDLTSGRGRRARRGKEAGDVQARIVRARRWGSR